MARRFKISWDVDDRTNGMTDEALICRSQGHKWTRRAASRRYTQDLLNQGLVEYFRYCEHGCGSTWRQVWSLTSKAIVSNERTYPTNGAYLMPKGEGRLPRGEAVVANAARELKAFA